MIAVLAFALVVLAVFTVLRLNDLSSQVKRLDSKASNLEATAAALKQTTSAEQRKTIAAQQKALVGLTAQLKKLQTCVPELQTEINGISLGETRTEYILENNSTVSNYCSPILYHSGP